MNLPRLLDVLEDAGLKTRSCVVMLTRLAFGCVEVPMYISGQYLPVSLGQWRCQCSLQARCDHAKRSNTLRGNKILNRSCLEHLVERT